MGRPIGKIGHTMVREQGSRSPVSCESTPDLFDAPVSWALLAACERAAVDMPEAIVAVFETDIVAHAGVGNVATACPRWH
jgi:hypothetical protein